MLDKFEKKSREASVEPPLVNRPALPYDGAESGEEGGSLTGGDNGPSDDDDDMI